MNYDLPWIIQSKTFQSMPNSGTNLGYHGTMGISFQSKLKQILEFMEGEEE